MAGMWCVGWPSADSCLAEGLDLGGIDSAETSEGLFREIRAPLEACLRANSCTAEFAALNKRAARVTAQRQEGLRVDPQDTSHCSGVYPLRNSGSS